MRRIIYVSSAALWWACVGPSPEPARADVVVEAPGATGEGFGDPERAVNGVRGGGDRAGSLDVYRIALDRHLVLAWSDRALIDGPGPDLVVFENPFFYGDGLTFMDPVIVEVSPDGVEWFAFEHDYLADDEETYSARADDWVGFAGITPVRLDEDEATPADPFDPEAAGGDAFDLAELGLEEIRFVRLRPASGEVNPDTGLAFPRDPVGDGPDIDGVIGRTLIGAP